MDKEILRCRFYTSFKKLNVSINKIQQYKQLNYASRVGAFIKRIIVFSAFFCFNFLFGQNTISGKISDNQNKPLEYATLKLKRDSVVVIQKLSDSLGNFTLSNLKPYKYVLVVSYIDFLEKEISLDAKKDTFINIQLIGNPHALKQIIVTSKKPIVERRADRLIFNVENSIGAQGGTAWDAIKLTPFVTTTELGSITSQGKPLGVLVDDKILQFSGEQLQAFLSAINSDNIKKIEVINNPPSKYEAEGLGGLLNIVLKKDKRQGLNGSARATYQQNTYAKFGLGTTLNYRKKKINLFANYNLGTGNYLVEETMWQKYSYNSNDTYFDEIENRKRYQNSNSIRAGMDYNFNDKNVIGILYTGIYGYRNPNDNTITSISKDIIHIDSIYRTNNTSHNTNSNTGINLNFKHIIDTLNSSFNFDIDYLNFRTFDNLFNSTSFYNASNQILHSPSLFKNNTTQIIKISSFKFDYLKNTKKATVIELGTKFSNSNTNNNLLYYNWDNSSLGYNYDTTRSNYFLYDESIFAIYGSYSGKLKKAEYKIGLRSEYTITKGQLVTTNQVTNNNYIRLFPTAYYLYTFNENYSLGLDYSRRIQRPAFWELNPFRLYFTPSSYSEGNPFLQPAFTDEININSVLKKKHNVSIYAGYTKDYFTQVSEQDNVNNTIKYTRVNLAKQYYYGISYNSSFVINKWWTFSSNLDLENEIQKTDYLNAALDYSITTLNAYLVNAFVLSKPRKITGEITANYISPRIEGVKKVSSTALVAAGIKMKAFKDNAEFTFYMFDIFKTNISKSNIEFLDQRSYSQQYYDTRGARLTMSWRFGKSTVPKNRERKTSNSEENSRIGG